MDEQQKEKKTLEQQYNYIENNRKIGDWLKKRFAWIVLVIASILFIFKEGLELTASGQDVVTLIMSGGLTYVFALYVSMALRRLGKKSGKDSSIFSNALKYLGEAKNNIKDIMYLLPVFLTYKNAQALEEAKKNYLEAKGIVYLLYKKDYYKNKKDLSDIQIKALKNVEKIKITTLTSSDLLAEHSKGKYLDTLYLGVDEKTDERASSLQMLISKAILPIVTSYFAVQVILGESLIWGAIQVSIILVIGVSHYMEGEDYIITELRNRQINKADLLIEFKNTYDNKKYLFKDEEEIIQTHLKQEQKEEETKIGLTQ
jgi:hypothetical protein